jgi:hypothetical protein
MTTMRDHSHERGPGHVHRWSVVLHADYCHKFEWAYTCACGAGKRTVGERDVRFDPWSAVWFDEAGECTRCNELAAGAEPTYSVVVFARDGTIERNEEGVYR